MQTNVPRRVYDFNRTLAESSFETTRTVATTVADGTTRAVERLRRAGAVVVGQARAAARRTFGEASLGARQVVGQARAQGAIAGADVDRIADRTARRATDAVDDAPSPGTPYERWSKSDLYERAQELGIEGRSSMTKAELIDALRAA